MLSNLCLIKFPVFPFDDKDCLRSIISGIHRWRPGPNFSSTIEQAPIHADSRKVPTLNSPQTDADFPISETRFLLHLEPWPPGRDMVQTIGFLFDGNFLVSPLTDDQNRRLDLQSPVQSQYPCQSHPFRHQRDSYPPLDNFQLEDCHQTNGECFSR